ncbi:hypothetical protein KEM54_001018, partial [Ascosphaera aggregata]
MSSSGTGNGGFSFPPPPPPPPPTKQQHHHHHKQQQFTQRNLHGQQQGSRSRGGSQRNRGSHQRLGGNGANGGAAGSGRHSNNKDGRYIPPEYASNASNTFVTYSQPPESLHHHSHPSLPGFIRDPSSPRYQHLATPSPSPIVLAQQPAYIAQQQQHQQQQHQQQQQQHQQQPAAFAQPTYAAGQFAQPTHFIPTSHQPHGPLLHPPLPPAQQHYHQHQQLSQVVAPPIHWTPDHVVTSTFLTGAIPAPHPSATATLPPYDGLLGGDSRGRHRQMRNRGGGGGGGGGHGGHHDKRGVGMARGNKRTHANAFHSNSQQQQQQQQQQKSKKPVMFTRQSTTTALPVPSFGVSLPSRPPIPTDLSRNQRKRRRKHNQLGLTPRTHEQEQPSSEDDNQNQNENEDVKNIADNAVGHDDDDDNDEESRLTQTLPTSAPLQFTYRGRTSKLQSAADIQAWIEERKKRYPTRARVERKKKEAEEKKAKIEEAKRLQKQERNRVKMEQKMQPNDTLNATAKARLKAEKLRKKLLKEEAKVARAEAAEARKATESSQKGEVENDAGTVEGFVVAEKNSVQVQNMPSAEPQVSKPEQELVNQVKQEVVPGTASLDVVEDPVSGGAPRNESDITVSANSKEFAEQHSKTKQKEMEIDEDWTSSSGSDTLSLTSLNDSDDDDDDDDDDEEEEEEDGDINDVDADGMGLDAGDDLVGISSNLEAAETGASKLVNTANGISEAIAEDSDSAPPDELTSKLNGPERVMPPPRKGDSQQQDSSQDRSKGKLTQICKQFSKFGQCQRGQECKFKHERQLKMNGNIGIGST